jgi:NADH-quinone oxidoreductase subunit N
VTEAIEQIRGAIDLIVPEAILVAAVCVLLVVGPLLVTDAGQAPARLRNRMGLLSLAAIVIAWIAWFQGDFKLVQTGIFRSDSLVWYVRGLSLSVGFLLALVYWNQIDDGHSAEAHACLLSILAGVNLVAVANDLVVLFLALELVSIPTYILLYLPRRDRLGGESTIKYFLLSIFSSALVLYGMSWLYGVTGSTNFAAIQDALLNRSPHAGEPLLHVAFALLVAGLCFRMAAVPFHFYAPDVFQGTTAANAAMLSVLPKAVGLVALMRLIPLTGETESWAHWIPDFYSKWLLAVLAAATMFTGNLLALRQRNLYRLMAYSSIAHAGYMLVGLATGDTVPVGGRQAVLFYLATYGLMTIGVFALVSCASSRDEPMNTTEELRGLSRRQPLIALLLTICLFSLTGLPPTAGFLGKLNLFLAAWADESRLSHALAILLALNAAISAYYYLRLVALMFLDAAEAEPKRMRIEWMPWLAGVACAVAMVVIFIAPQWLWNSLP